MKKTLIIIIMGLLSPQIGVTSTTNLKYTDGVYMRHGSPITQSYNNDKWFKVCFHKGDTLRIYNRTGVEILSMIIPDNEFIFSVDRYIGKCTIRVNGFSKTYDITPKNNLLPPKFKY